LTVARLFGLSPAEIVAGGDYVRIGNTTYRIDRGIVLLDDQVVRESTQRGTGEDVRRSFSEEWQTYGAILPEHDDEFAAYFDVVELASLRPRAPAPPSVGPLAPPSESP
jgi:hypothetical protein